MIVGFWLASASAAPVFGTERGLYDAPFDLTLTADGGGDLLYGLGPNAPATTYANPIPIDRTTTVRAVEVALDGTRSEIGTHTYVFVADILASGVLDPSTVSHPTLGPELETSLRTMQTAAVTVPGGLSLTEAVGVFEWFDPLGDPTSVTGGVHIVGGTSYVYPKASIRLNFRTEYGTPKFEFDLYGPDATGTPAIEEHDALTLRSGNHDTMYWLADRGQHLRNWFMDESQLEMGHVAPHGRMTHLYVNGVYHGVFHVRERFNSGFLEGYLGGPDEGYEVVTGGVPEDGTGAAWNAVVATGSDYEQFEQWVNVPQYLDYMVLQYYGANAWDWYSWHNWMSGGPVVAGGRERWIFHGNDEDITLWYPVDTDILYLGGPSDVFPALLAEGHPDFRVALADAIHRNLEGSGPLGAGPATVRYQRLADEIESAMVAEAARWGEGWWDRDEEWRTERDYLLTTYFPFRADLLLGQVRAAGWYPVQAPAFDVVAGDVGAGTVVAVSSALPGAELWVTTDGRDPRLPGGEPAPTATEVGDAVAIEIDHSTEIRARHRWGSTWGAVEIGRFTVDEAPLVILNEWNAVAPDEVLLEGDPALGVVPGNGGDWVELLVLADVDLRGWRLTTEDRLGPLGELQFTDDPLLASVRAGTIVTLAEDLPEDAAYDPDAGDWRFHLRAGSEGTGQYVSTDPLDVTALDWRLTLWDAEGHVRSGPVGESVEPFRGLGDDEVGALKGPPHDGVRPDTEDYGAADGSTYGAENTWYGGAQDLSGLRGLDEDGLPGDTPDPADPGEPTAGSPDPSPSTASGCGCGGSAPGSLWIVVVAMLAACARTPDGGHRPPSSSTTPEPDPEPTADCFADRDGDGYGDATPAPCTESAAAVGDDCDDLDPDVHPGALERCDDVDEDCDGAVDDDPVDGLPYYTDGDGDGAGVEPLTRACAIADGLVFVGGDCDDADPGIGPFAVEVCGDEIDQDCDGTLENGIGASPDCPAATCLDVLAFAGADGPYWLSPAGGPAIETWCDSTTDGGGWTLGFVRNSASLGSQLGFGGPGGGVDGLSISSAVASAEAIGRLAWHDLESWGWTELRVAAYAGGAQTFVSDTIPRGELRIAFGQDGYLLYGGATGYWWCGGAATYTDGGVGAVNNPPLAPADCKGHGALGTGWDFSDSAIANQGLTLCGPDASSWMHDSWIGGLVPYGVAGAAQAVWVR